MMKISSQLLLILPLAMGIGIAMAFQTAINSQLREYLYSPLQAALFSFLVGTIVLAILVFFQQVEKPNLSTLLNIPWYLWIGGCLGVYAISMSIYSAPKLSLLTLSGVIIFGQMVTSMLIDHFGFLGTEKVAINWQRLLGGVVVHGVPVPATVAVGNNPAYCIASMHARCSSNRTAQSKSWTSLWLRMRMQRHWRRMFYRTRSVKNSTRNGTLDGSPARAGCGPTYFVAKAATTPMNSPPR